MVGPALIEFATDRDARRGFDLAARVAVDEDVQLHARLERVLLVPLARQELGLLEGDVLLELHDLRLALGLDLVGHSELWVVLHRAGGRAGLFGVLEHPHRVEADLLDEFEELLVICLRLAREAGDERRADRDAGHAVAELVHEFELLLGVDMAAHEFEHALARVLEGDVDVGQHVPVL